MVIRLIGKAFLLLAILELLTLSSCAYQSQLNRQILRSYKKGDNFRWTDNIRYVRRAVVCVSSHLIDSMYRNVDEIISVQTSQNGKALRLVLRVRDYEELLIAVDSNCLITEWQKSYIVK